MPDAQHRRHRESDSQQVTNGQNVDDPSLARLGAFSDGVFAFAITLLVLGIRIPHPSDADAGRGLLALLTHEWRSYLAYLLSFMLGGINWANHRIMFSTFSRATHGLVWLNLLYLMVAVAFIPIPTAVLGAWLGSPGNQVVAAVFYGTAATVGGITYVVLWLYGAYVAHLTSPKLTARERRAHTIAWVPAPFVMAGLTGLAFVNPLLAVGGFVGMVVLYVLPVPTLVGMKQRWHERRAKQHGPPTAD